MIINKLKKHFLFERIVTLFYAICYIMLIAYYLVTLQADVYVNFFLPFTIFLILFFIVNLVTIFYFSRMAKIYVRTLFTKEERKWRVIPLLTFITVLTVISLTRYLLFHEVWFFLRYS